MGRRAIAKRLESTKEIELLLADQRDIDDHLGPGQNRQQTQEPHLIQRIYHLRPLTWVRQFLEISQ